MTFQRFQAPESNSRSDCDPKVIVAKVNRRKHRISFEDAATVFLGETVSGETVSGTVSATFLASFVKPFRSHSRTLTLCGSTMINLPA